MGIQSGTEKRAALAYAASQGWIDPVDAQLLRNEENHVVRSVTEASADMVRIADLQVALDAERESHAVTKAALLRIRGKSAGQRIIALEAALAKLTGDDVTEADLDAAKALLKQ